MSFPNCLFFNPRVFHGRKWFSVDSMDRQFEQNQRVTAGNSPIHESTKFCLCVGFKPSRLPGPLLVSKMPPFAHQSASEPFGPDPGGAQQRRAASPAGPLHHNRALDIDRRRGGDLRSPGVQGRWPPPTLSRGMGGPTGASGRAGDGAATLQQIAAPDASCAVLGTLAGGRLGCGATVRTWCVVRVDPAGRGRPGQPGAGSRPRERASCSSWSTRWPVFVFVSCLCVPGQRPCIGCASWCVVLRISVHSVAHQVSGQGLVDQVAGAAGGDRGGRR
jgi:hypothetical protein